MEKTLEELREELKTLLTKIDRLADERGELEYDAQNIRDQIDDDYDELDDDEIMELEGEAEDLEDRVAELDCDLEELFAVRDELEQKIYGLSFVCDGQISMFD